MAEDRDDATTREDDAAAARAARAEAARLRIEMSAGDGRIEAARAQQLIDEFVVKAREQGLEPVPLKATTFEGKQVRTDKEGWYLRRNHTLAIGTDGSYYQLVVPAPTFAWLRGVKLRPTPPSLQVGRGGRDGETGDLAEFLQWTLEGRNQ